MTIPYIPGWWDMTRGSAMNFASALDQRLRPDKYAQMRLQEAIQRDPSLAQRIADMDPQAREILLGGYGATASSEFAQPILNAPAGRNRKAEETKQQLLDDAVATDKAGVLSRQFGARTPEEHQSEALGVEALKQRIEAGGLDIKQKKFAVSEIERIQNRLAEAYKNTQGIDINPAQIVQNIISGKPVDSDVMNVIMDDPGMRTQFDLMFKLAQLGMQQRFNMQLRGANFQDNVATMYLNATKDIGTQLKQAIAARNRLAENPFFIAGEPETVKRMKDLTAQIESLSQQYNELRGATFSFIGDRMGGLALPEIKVDFGSFDDSNKLNNAATPQGFGPQRNLQLEEQARAAIQARPESAELIKASFKRKTGYDLP